MTIIELCSDARVAATLKKAMYPKELVDQLHHLSSRVTALTECIQQRDDKIKKLEGKVTQLELEADKVEQYSRRSNLRFTGLPETTGESENTKDKLIDIINNNMCPDMPVRRDQIERSQRLGPKMDKDGKPRQRAIIIRFVSEKVRDHVYRARFQLKDHNASSRNKVFVNEDLTATRGALAYQTRQLKKAGNITDCWTTAGTVLINTKYGLVVNVSSDSDLCAYVQV